MKFYKIFTLSCLAVLAVLALYIALVFAYKSYRIDKITNFYAEQRAIALREAAVAYPLQPPKNIPLDRPVRILVLEGGGIDGLISAKLLVALEQKAGRPISELFDIITGSSVGALQTIFLTIPSVGAPLRPKYSAQDLLNVMSHESFQALNASTADWLLSGLGLIAPPIDTGAYIHLIQRYAGMTQLSQLTTNVLLTGYDIPHRQVLFFTSRQSASNQGNFLAYQLLAGITAFEGMMPPQLVAALGGSTPKRYLLGDAGNVINNPLVAALQYANELYPYHQKTLVFLGMGLDQERPILPARSYFNGLLQAAIEYYNMTWSHDKLLKLFLTSLQQSHSFGLTHLFFIEEKNIAISDSTTSPSPESMATLLSVGDAIVNDHQQQLQQLATQLTAHS